MLDKDEQVAEVCVMLESEPNERGVLALEMELPMRHTRKMIGRQKHEKICTKKTPNSPRNPESMVDKTVEFELPAV